MDVVRLIPQLYYDLLSRVFSGGMTILAVTLAVDFKLGSILAYVLEGAPPLQGRRSFWLSWFSSRRT